VLNFQLTNPLQYWPTFDEHYVTVDFTGWRYFELHLKERDAERYGDYSWPYGDAYSVYRNPLIRHSVSALSLYYTNLPADREARCHITPIKALPVARMKLANPVVSIGGKRIVFPVALESGQYIEMTSLSDCKLYFSCDKLEGTNVRAKLTFIIEDEPIRGMSPQNRIDWNWLREERK